MISVARNSNLPCRAPGIDDFAAYPRTIQSTTDYPKLVLGNRANANNAFVFPFNDIDYSFELRTEINWMNHDVLGQSSRDIIYPLGWFEWKVRFKVANGDQLQPGATTSVTIDYHLDNSPTFPYVGTLANAAFEWSGPF